LTSVYTKMFIVRIMRVCALKTRLHLRQIFGVSAEFSIPSSFTCLSTAGPQLLIRVRLYASSKLWDLR
jgi:hypothetical protein